MPCSQCKTKTVIALSSGVSLCKNCFVKYFEKKAFKTISRYELIKEKEKFGVAISGGKASLTALSLISKFAEQKLEISMIALSIDEGIKGYSEKLLKNVKDFCQKNEIELHTYSFKKEFGLTFDEIAKKVKKVNPRTARNILKKYLLNKKAKELGVDKLVIGHTLDYEAQTVIINLFKKSIEANAHLGPITGIGSDERFVKRINPLYFLSEKEVAIYASIKSLLTKDFNDPYSENLFRTQVAEMLDNLEEKYSGIKNAVINSLMEISPLLKEAYKDSEKARNCKSCGEPCQKEICTACQILKKLKK